MKKIIYALMLLLFVACGSNNEKTPGEVAAEFFTAITSGNNEFIKEYIYISDEIQREVFFSTIDIAVKSEQYKQNTKNFTPAYEIASETIEDEEAEVVLTGTSPLGQRVRITVKLLLINGSWKVNGDHGVWH